MTISRPDFRYSDRPTLWLQYSCSGAECGIATVEFDDDQLVCTHCGTAWPRSIDGEVEDGDKGTLWEEWTDDDVSDLPAKEVS